MLSGDRRFLFSFAVGLGGVLIGFAVMLGWWLRWPLVVAVPGTVAMVFNTALCFVLVSGALFLLSLRAMPASRALTALGGALAAIAALALWQRLFAIDPWIDWAPLHAWLGDGNPTPGRMSAPAAAGFLMFGAALMLAPRVRRPWQAALVRTLTLGAGSIGVLALAGRVLRLDLLYQEYVFQGIALLTAAGLALVAVGLWSAWNRCDWGRRPVFGREDDRITAFGAAVLVAVALSAAVAGFATLQRGVEASFRDRVGVLHKSRAELIQVILDARAIGAGFTAAQPAVLRGVHAIRAGRDDSSNLANLRALIGGFLRQGFSGLAYYDADGALVASSGHLAQAPALAVRLAAPIHAELLWDGRFLYRSRIPVRDAQGEAGVVLAEAPMPVLTRLMLEAVAVGETAEMGLCAMGENKLLCFPQHRNPEIYSIPLASANGEPLPMTRALKGESGVVMTRDYREKDVIAAYGPVGPLGLGLVVKADVAEVYQPIRDQLHLALVSLFILAAVGALLLRAQISPLARRLVENEERLRLITENIPALISYIDAKQVFRFNNKTYEDWLGVPRAQITGRPVKEVLGEQAYEKFRPHIEAALSGKRVSFETELPRNGAVRHVQGTYVPQRGKQGEVLGIYGLVSDITQLKRAEEQLVRLAQHDVLTGLANRGLLQDRLAQALARSRRSGDLLALMYLDIDRFKSINDELGHAGGDALLKEFALRLVGVVRGTDTVARPSGDEFVVVLEGIGDRERARKIAESVIQAMTPDFSLDGRPVAVRTSIGIALCEGGGVEPEALLKQADAALYEAKRAGRNTYRVAS